MNWLQPLPILIQRADGSALLTTHAFFFILGAVLAAFYVLRRLAVLNISSNQLLTWVLGAFIAGLFGARFGYLLAYPAEWVVVSDLFAIWRGGLVSYAGLLVGGLYLAIATGRLSRVKQLQVLDVFMIATLIAWAVGRWGNYYAIESVGVPSAVWEVTYGRVPIQLFESVLCAAAALLLHKLLGTYKPGIIALVGIGSYGLIRFLVDFWRDETVWNGLRVSQWVGLCMALASFCIWLQSRKPSHT